MSNPSGIDLSIERKADAETMLQVSNGMVNMILMQAKVKNFLQQIIDMRKLPLEERNAMDPPMQKRESDLLNIIKFYTNRMVETAEAVNNLI